MAVLAQAAENIFHIDDGVIDQFADGHGQAAQRHGVDPETGRMENDEGGEQRQGNRGQGDRRCAEVEQENKEHDRHHETAIAQGLLHIAHGPGDEIALTKNVGVNLDPVRQRPPDDLQLGLDLPGQSNGVRPGLFLHREDHARTPVDAGITSLVERCPLADLGDLPEENARSIGQHLHHRDGQILRTFHPGQIADQPLIVRIGKKTSGGIDVRLVDGRLHLVQGHPGGHQQRRVDQHLILPHVPAHHGDLRDAGNAHQAATHVPVGQSSQFHRTDRRIFTGQADGHDLAHNRGDRPEEWPGILGQLRGHFGDFFRHNLARPISIGLPAEFHEDQR